MIISLQYQVSVLSSFLFVIRIIKKAFGNQTRKSEIRLCLRYLLGDWHMQMAITCKWRQCSWTEQKPGGERRIWTTSRGCPSKSVSVKSCASEDERASLTKNLDEKPFRLPLPSPSWVERLYLFCQDLLNIYILPARPMPLVNKIYVLIITYMEHVTIQNQCHQGRWTIWGLESLAWSVAKTCRKKKCTYKIAYNTAWILSAHEVGQFS